MNIDFHYGIMYIVARVAGMSPQDAKIVAHACQYVDDATTDGALLFREGQSFDRFASAHKLIDYRNNDQVRDERVWTPFHFIPAGIGETFEEQATCRANSDVAKRIVGHTLENCHEADNALHRLGVCLHAYVDTWAHQGFSGIKSKRNLVHWIHLNGSGEIGDVAFHLRDLIPNITAECVDFVSDIGHGAAAHYPDSPWLRWHYRNQMDEKVERDNPKDFVEAADMAARVIRAFMSQSSFFEEHDGLTTSQKKELESIFVKNENNDEGKRLEFIFNAAEAQGICDIKEQIPFYIPKGIGSWKHLATGIKDTIGDGIGLADASLRPLWGDEFENSDYRKVHDAIKLHRSTVTDTVFTRHRLRIA